MYSVAGAEVWISGAIGFPADGVAWCLSEQRKGTNELGFVPAPRFHRDAAAGRLICVVYNGDLVAFLLRGVGRRGGFQPIIQLWTRQDARRALFASAACLAAAAEAQKENRIGLQARCGLDLRAASCLWSSLGFTPVAWRRGGVSRRRTILVWRRRF